MRSGCVIAQPSRLATAGCPGVITPCSLTSSNLAQSHTLSTLLFKPLPLFLPLFWQKSSLSPLSVILHAFLKSHLKNCSSLTTSPGLHSLYRCMWGAPPSVLQGQPLPVSTVYSIFLPPRLCALTILLTWGHRWHSYTSNVNTELNLERSGWSIYKNNGQETMQRGFLDTKCRSG